MLANSIAFALCSATLAAAHFSIDYPEMRGDSFAEGASQYLWPCANVNQTAQTNRTLWPLTGGSISLDLHHQWSYVFINLGLGTDYPTFNISLTPSLLNETGNGTFCLPKLTLPAGLNIVDGQNASIQVATGGAAGTGLYNCADITFSSNATILPAESCANSSNVAATIVSASSTHTHDDDTTNTSTTTPSPTSAAVTHSTSMMTSGIFAGLGAVMISWLL